MTNLFRKAGLVSALGFAVCMAVPVPAAASTPVCNGRVYYTINGSTTVQVTSSGDLFGHATQSAYQQCNVWLSLTIANLTANNFATIHYQLSRREFTGCLCAEPAEQPPGMSTQ